MRRKKTGEISREKNELPVNRSKRLPSTPKRAAATLRQTIEEVWRRLQVDEETALFYIAQDNPKWFYELCKGMFPKDLFIQHDMNVNAMSPDEIRIEIVRILTEQPELAQALQLSAPSEDT